MAVDECGIKINEKPQPVGSYVAHGDNANGPTSVYSMVKYLDWLKAYTSPEA